MTDVGFSHVTAELLSSPELVPDFLIARGLVHGVCEGDEPIGIGVFVDSRHFESDVLGAGGETGSQRKCNSNFIGQAASDE